MGYKSIDRKQTAYGSYNSPVEIKKTTYVRAPVTRRSYRSSPLFKLYGMEHNYYAKYF